MADTDFMGPWFGRLHYIAVEGFRGYHGTTQPRYLPALPCNSSAISAESLVISET